MIPFILGLGRFIPAWIKRAVAWAAVAAVALLGAWGAGKREGGQAAKKRDAEAYKKTRKRIDNVKGSTGNADDDIEWLRDFGDK